MREVASLLVDLGNEFGRLGAIFQGGLACIPGVLILLGGCSDPSVVCSLTESLNLLSTNGGQFHKETWDPVSGEIYAHGVGVFSLQKKFATTCLPTSLTIL